MKQMIWIAMMFSSLSAQAMTECAGRAADGTLVTVQVSTTGARGLPERGSVLFERSGNRFGYKFERNEISQFFEYDDTQNQFATVGLNAYVKQDAPLQVRYVDRNYVDLDLKAVVDDANFHSAPGNFLRVWKGSGYAAAEQYQITNFACSVWANL